MSNSLCAKICFSIAAILFTLNIHAKVTTEVECNYGPSETNLAVLIDSFEGSFLFGYTTSELFFELNYEGCNKLTLDNNQLSCDSKLLGVVERKFLSEDSSYSGLIGVLKINPEADVEIDGDCGEQSLVIRN